MVAAGVEGQGEEAEEENTEEIEQVVRCSEGVAVAIVCRMMVQGASHSEAPLRASPPLSMPLPPQVCVI